METFLQYVFIWEEDPQLKEKFRKTTVQNLKELRSAIYFDIILCSILGFWILFVHHFSLASVVLIVVISCCPLLLLVLSNLATMVTLTPPLTQTQNLNNNINNNKNIHSHHNHNHNQSRIDDEYDEEDQGEASKGVTRLFHKFQSSQGNYNRLGTESVDLEMAPTLRLSQARSFSTLVSSQSNFKFSDHFKNPSVIMILWNIVGSLSILSLNVAIIVEQRFCLDPAQSPEKLLEFFCHHATTDQIAPHVILFLTLSPALFGHLLRLNWIFVGFSNLLLLLFFHFLLTDRDMYSNTFLFFLGVWMWCFCLLLYEDEKERGRKFYSSWKFQSQVFQQAQAQRDATKAREEKEAFVSYIMHEVRVYFNNLYSGVDILHSSDVKRDEKELKAIDIMHKSATQMKRMLNDVLDLAKLEQGKFELEMKPFAFCPVLRGIVNLFSLRANEKNITLTIQDESLSSYLGDYHVSWDSLRYTQILTNFLSNALKFTGQNGEIIVRCEKWKKPKEVKEHDEDEQEEEEESPDEITIKTTVIDNGCGIRLADQKKIFKPFVQSKNRKLNDPDMGTGIGLAICSRLCRGQCGLISEEKKGSTFWFLITGKLEKSRESNSDTQKLIHDLTAPKDIKPPSNTSSTPLILKQNVYRDIQDLYVLIVDDAEHSRGFTATYLEKIGWPPGNILHAESGSQAISKCTNQISLIIIDYNMPDMDGVDTIREIRKSHRTLPVIAISGDVSQEIENQWNAVGVSIVLSKPTTIKRLSACLNDIFS